MKIFSDFFASVSKLFDASDLRSFCDIAIATLLTLVRYADPGRRSLRNLRRRDPGAGRACIAGHEGAARAGAEIRLGLYQRALRLDRAKAGAKPKS